MIMHDRDLVKRARDKLGSTNLLGVNPKVEKGVGAGYATSILHLSPSDLSGYQTCPYATAGCRAACLNSAGQGGTFTKCGNVADQIRDTATNKVQAARIKRTRLFFEDRPAFMALLVHETRLAIERAARVGLVPVFRFNGTSDIRWERIGLTVEGQQFRNIMALFPHVIFYDYTKNPLRVKLPANYHLTFSLAESNLDAALQFLATGRGNVAVVFRANGRKHEPLPASWRGFEVIDADETDLRFNDKPGTIAGLRCKGEALKDSTGFVQEVA
jgi:hypothetical protein